MNLKGPHVAVAALCDAILVEKDERISCIRFLDRFEIGIPENAPDPFQVPLQINCFLSFKSGDFVGTKTVRVKLKHPLISEPKAPTIMTPNQFEADFKGGEHGYNITLQLNIVVDGSGLFMFDVLLDEDVVTRIPLRIDLKRVPLPQSEELSSPHSEPEASEPAV